MDSFANLLSSLIANTVPTIILLGILIFVHELGHFLVAKYYKVRVEVFSLGFGPKLFSFKRGDTVYAISAIPLGGYVKMFGDDPTAEVSSDQKQFSFINKPVSQRIAIVLAGPLMNLFFAIILFAMVANVGEVTVLPKLGDIDPKTPAYAAGFRSGDTVVSIAGEPVKTWEQFQQTLESNAEKALPVQVARATDNKTETLQVSPKLVQNKNVLSWQRQVGEVEGLSYLSQASIVGVKNPESPAGKAGMQTGDIIASINGTQLDKWRELRAALEKNANTDTLTVEVSRGLLSDKDDAPLAKQTVTLQVPAEAKGKSPEEMAKALGFEFPELYLFTIEKGSAGDKAGLKPGDRLVSIDNQTVESFSQVTTIINSFGNKDNSKERPPLDMMILRDGKEIKVSVAPNKDSRMDQKTGREEERFRVGISSLGIVANPATFEQRYTNPIDIAKRATVQTWKWTNLTVLSFVRLFQGDVSPKNIGGLFSIGKMANKSFAVGLASFLSVMALISINLFILNLLPVPVLDGGHLVFYTIEALRGAPLSMRKMEIAQQVGLVLLLGLMVFALFNDVTRL